MPQTSQRIGVFLGVPCKKWSELGEPRGLEKIGTPEILFAQLDDELIESLRSKFSGSQKERAQREEDKIKHQGKSMEESTTPETPVKLTTAQKIALEDKDLGLGERFTKRVDLRVAKILKAEQHPEADKLYIETLDDGISNERIIVSGLVPFYTAEELTGKHIILVSNLKPAKLRGVKSHGMLLAASLRGGEEEIVEVIEAPWASPGARITIEGQDPASIQTELPQIDIDTFFNIPLSTQGGVVKVGGVALVADGQKLTATRVTDGPVG
jgi:methionyl-tRNA synthetase